MSSVGRSTVDPATARLRQARADLERGVRAGEPTRTEDVLAEFPDLADSSDAFLELAYSEFVLREQLGQKPDPDDWLARFPRWATDLRQLFEVHFEYRETGDDPDPVFHPDFEIIEEVGRGGMGVVYRARQKSLNRVVALKVVLSGEHAGAKERERFKREAEAAARLQHPNIVQVFEVGEADNRPFCAMEYVGGGTLAKKMGGTPWAARPAAELVATVARAVQHAHDNGIVHRDLKPANVLLSVASGQSPVVADATGSPTLSAEGIGGGIAGRQQQLATGHWQLAAPKVTDFGLAKCLTDSDPGPTRTGDLLGTPAYMAPEQAEGRAKLVGPATDVWALGVILYELLTGHPPFQGESAVETLRQVQHTEPVPPRRLQPRLSRDIETVCLKCLRKNPLQRYASAAALADDLERWLRGETIKARPVGFVGRAGRWCARNPWVAALSGLVVALVAVAVWLGVVAVLHLDESREQSRIVAHREREARMVQEAARKKEAEERLTERQRVVRLLVEDGVRRQDEGDSAGAALWFAAALENEPNPTAELTHRVRLGAALGDLPRLRGSFWAEPSFMPPNGLAPLNVFTLNPIRDPRRVTVFALAADASTVFTSNTAGATAYDVRTGKVCSAPPAEPVAARSPGAPSDKPSSNGRAHACVRDAKVVVTETATGKQLPVPLGRDYGALPSPFSPDGSRYVGFGTERFPARQRLALYTAAGERIGEPLGDILQARAFEFTPDGTRLAVGDGNGTVTIWDASTGEAIGAGMSHGRAVNYLAISPNGKRLLSAGADNTAQVWNVETQKPVGHRLQHGAAITGVGFSPDGGFAVLVGGNGPIRVWDAETGLMVGGPLTHPHGVMGAAFSPNSAMILTRSADGTARVWEAKTGRPLTPLLSHTSPVVAAAFTPDSKSFATVGFDGNVRLWDVPARTTPVVKHGAAAASGAWLNGTTVVTVGEKKALVWDAATGLVRHEFPHELPPRGTVFTVRASPSGHRFATVASDGAARLWDPATGKQVGGDLRHTKMAYAVAFVSDDTLATGGLDGRVLFWNAATGEAKGTPFVQKGTVITLAVAPDGRRLLVRGSEVGLWDVTAGERLLVDGDTTTNDAVMSGDGERVLISSRTGRVRVFHSQNGQPVRDPIDVGKWTASLVVSRDGKRMATSAINERAVQVWDVDTGAPVGPPLRHRSSIGPIAFTPDGRFLATASDDGGARVWEVPSGAAASPVLEYGSVIRFGVVSPNGRRFLVCAADGGAGAWELVPDTRPVEQIVAQARLLATRRLDARGVAVALTPAEEVELFEQSQAPPK